MSEEESAPGGSDAGDTANEGSAPESASTTSTPAAPSLDDVKAWHGYRVDEISGHAVATVEGVFVDKKGGDPVWILVKLGRFGKVIPVSIRECAAAAGRVWVPHEREVIRNAPAVDPSLPLNRQQEQQVLEYYEIPEAVGRGAEIADRGAEEVTAEPVP